MEKLTRMKKYEQLRKDIDFNQDVQPEIELKDTASKLFRKIEIREEENVVPQRIKDIEPAIYVEDTFQNEYMDDFIKEVKRYNKDKGLISSEVTEIDILSQLKTPIRPKREEYVKPLIQPEPVEDIQLHSTIQQSKEEIARQIQQLLQEDTSSVPTSGMNVTKVDIPEEPYHEDDKKSEELLQKFNEETQQIKIKMERHDREFDSLQSGIDKTNKLLNTVLLIFVLAILGIMGFAIYWMLVQSGGSL